MRMNAAARGAITLAEARDVTPDALAAARSLAWLAASNGRRDVARTILAGLVALDAGDAWSWRTLAAIELERGDVPAAREAATQAASIARSRGVADPAASWLLARVLLAEGRPGEAEPWLAAISSDPSAPVRVAASARALQRRLAGS